MQGSGQDFYFLNSRNEYSVYAKYMKDGDGKKTYLQPLEFSGEPGGEIVAMLDSQPQYVFRLTPDYPPVTGKWVTKKLIVLGSRTLVTVVCFVISATITE